MRLLATTLLASAAVAALSLASMPVGAAKEKPPRSGMGWYAATTRSWTTSTSDPTWSSRHTSV